MRRRLSRDKLLARSGGGQPLKRSLALGLLAAALIWPLLANSDEISAEQSLAVTASAYNSVESQTDSEPRMAAWGDQLEPGMKAIAVSRDLLELGLDHRTTVTIDGLPGEYWVLDKMNPRWEKRIDIYMGQDVDAAREWGLRDVWIRW